jgi:hypothetical protein
MRVIFAILAVLPVMLVGQPGSSAPEILPTKSWRSIEMKEGQCSVLMPFKPQKLVDTLNATIGQVINYQYYAREDPTTFMVSFWEYPQESLPMDSVDFVQDFFEATIAESLTSTQGSLVYQIKDDFFEWPSQLWRIEFGEPKKGIKARGILVRNRFYLIQVVSLTNNFTSNPYPERFIKSFKLNNEP